ncbi:MAG: transcription antitermination factor NusB [Cellvibrionaceae bacterium]
MTSPAARRKARHYAMQAIYQWQLTQLSTEKIVRQFQDEYDMAHVDVPYFQELVAAMPEKAEELDDIFELYLQDVTIKELDPISHALLRVGVYELKERIDVPYKVAISEAVSLAKKFGASESHKFINGVLDKVSKQLRPVERG